MSIADFKAKKGVERIEVKQNPQSGKCFIVFGIETIPLFRRYVPLIRETCSTCYTRKEKEERPH